MFLLYKNGKLIKRLDNSEYKNGKIVSFSKKTYIVILPLWQKLEKPMNEFIRQINTTITVHNNRIIPISLIGSQFVFKDRQKVDN